jgi:hypothetical protein
MELDLLSIDVDWGVDSMLKATEEPSVTHLHRIE